MPSATFSVAIGSSFICQRNSASSIAIGANATLDADATETLAAVTVEGNAYFPQVANVAATSDAGAGPALGGELQPLTLDVTLTYELPGKA